MFGKKKKQLKPTIPYDSSRQIPAIKASICTGEQVIGFKDKQSGHFTEVMLIKKADDLATFKKMYGFEEDVVIAKEY